MKRRRGRWIDEEQEGETTLIIRQAFPPKICLGRLNGGQQLTQLQDKLTKGPTPPLTADPAAFGQAVDFFFSLPLFSLPVNVCPSSGAPGRRRSSSLQPDFNLFSVLQDEPEEERECGNEEADEGLEAVSLSGFKTRNE